MTLRASMLLLALAVGGCSSVAPPPAPPSRADQRAATPQALVVERQWLQSWFKGTPVAIEQRVDGALYLDVPREFCFEPGHSSIKPALAAVLNKLAESLLRVPASRLTLLAAPDDATGSAALGQVRANQVQRHLVSRGVPAARLGRPVTTSAAAVQLRMEGAAH